jgi:DNA-binding response OmpR family regulator
MLIMTVDDSEEDVLKRILSVVDTGKDTFNLLEASKPNLIFHGLEIDENHSVIIKDNREIELTYIEFEVLLLLARHLGLVFSKEQIYYNGRWYSMSELVEIWDKELAELFEQTADYTMIKVGSYHK